MPTNDAKSLPNPPRSGHVTFRAGDEDTRSSNDNMYVFGGYGEEMKMTPEGEEAVQRYPMNDLWRRRACSSDKEGWCSWEPVEQISPPEERLVSAVSVLNGRPYLFGGWNPNNRNMCGNEILDTVHSLNINMNTHQWTELPIKIPDGPTSRHVALTLPCKTKALIHNHRCGTDHVYVFDSLTESFVRQKTKAKEEGEIDASSAAPQGMGLHAACMLGSFALFFGGADKTQGMSNEAFLLNTITWEWSKVDILGMDDDGNDGNDDIPCPRASPCLVSFNETCAILYGGARGGAMGLEGLDDVWALYVNRFDSTGKWERLVPSTPTSTSATSSKSSTMHASEGDDGLVSVTMPPGRNAATLCEIDDAHTVDAKETKHFLLHGGWAPFRKTWNDDFILRVVDPTETH